MFAVSVLAAACLTLATLAPPASAGPRSSDRQVRVFETALNTMLVDSPNFLVQSSDPTIGQIVQGQGAAFSFKTSLVSNWDSHGNWWSWVGSQRGRRSVDDRYDREDRGRISKKNLARQERLYQRGKEEIIDTILTFGEVLSALQNDDVIEVRARLRDADYFHENDLRRLYVSVRVSDLRAFYDGQINQSEAVSRFQIEEE